MKTKDLISAIFVIIILWYATALLIQQAIMPFPHEVIITLVKELLNGLLEHFSASLWRVLVSIFLAVMTAAPLGMVLGQSKRINHFLSPFIYIIYPIPKVVLVPLFILLLGIGNLPKIAIIYVILFFQIFVLVRDQASKIKPELIQSVRSLGARRRALFRYVYFPASLPAILTALRQSVGTAVAVLYIAELIATRKGLGYYIYLNGSTLYNFPAMFAGIIMMSVLGLSLYFSVDWLERILCSWQFVE